MFSLIIVFLVVGSDQITKHLISQIISPRESIIIVKNFFYLTLVHNTGVAFGMFKNQTIVFIVISIIAIVLILYNMFYQKKYRKLHKLDLVAFSLILGGALGNLIDRLRFGYVIDFLDFRIWPVFNIADSAITIGIILLIITCIPSFSK